MVFRVGLIGLGMAVTPHAKSLLDLKDRAQVAYAYSPSAERRSRFAERFPFPQCDRLETILEDRTVDAVLVLTPPNTHLERWEPNRVPAALAPTRWPSRTTGTAAYYPIFSMRSRRTASRG